MQVAHYQSQTRMLLWRTGGWIIALFWMVQFLEITLVALVEGSDIATRLLLPRTLTVLAGIALSAPIIEVAARSGGVTFGRRLCLTVGTALAMCVALMGVNYLVYYVPAIAVSLRFDVTEFIYTAFGWSWFFLGLAGAVFGLAYSVEMRDRERRLADMETVAKDARLAALHYQINPHFLFNTLNSIAALIAGGDHRPAETMVETLADFLRTTLELDPVDEIPLAREIELQSLYLSIEQVRFPSRLRATYDIAPAAARMPVPALITQPLVENAIRHSVARSVAPVTISISAAVCGGRLRLTVQDDGPSSQEPFRDGLGVGMANVTARLENRYGSRASLTAERLDPGFRASIEIDHGDGR